MRMPSGTVFSVPCGLGKPCAVLEGHPDGGRGVVNTTPISLNSISRTAASSYRGRMTTSIIRPRSDPTDQCDSVD